MRLTPIVFSQALYSDVIGYAFGGSVAFASLGLSLDKKQGKQKAKKFKHPTCEHETDLQSLFEDIDTDSQGYLDVHHLRVRQLL